MPKDYVEYVLFRIPSFPGDMYSSMLGISECGALKQRCSSTPSVRVHPSLTKHCQLYGREGEGCISFSLGVRLWCQVCAIRSS
jgi:hypothetical protein